MNEWYSIQGRTIIDEDQSGVPGLLIELFSQGGSCLQPLGKTWSDADGEFSIGINLEKHNLDRQENIYLQINDRSQSLLEQREYSIEEVVVPDFEIEVILNSEELVDHYQVPLIWSQPNSEVFPQERIEVISTAVKEHLAAEETDNFDKYMQIVWNPLEGLLELTTDREAIYEAFRGVPEKKIQFQETLEALSKTTEVPTIDETFLSSGWLETAQERILAREIASRLAGDEGPQFGSLGQIEPQSELITSIREVVNSQVNHKLSIDSDIDIDRIYSEVSEELGDVASFKDINHIKNELSSRPPIIDPMTATVLVGAALRAGDEREQKQRFVATILEYLRGAQAITELYVVAERSLRGEATKVELRTAFASIAAEWMPTEEPFPGGPPVPMPIPLEEVEAIERLAFIEEHLWWVMCVLRWEALTQRLGVSPTVYFISDIQPSNACSGDQITITGTNFGDEPSQVYFDTTDGIAYVEADSWTASKIEVTVPPETQAGFIGLDIRHTGKVCGKVLEGRWSPDYGSLRTFAGGKPVLSIRINGETGDTCAEPGEDVEITWSTAPTGTVSVDVNLPFPYAGLANQGKSGLHSFTVDPAIDQPESIQITVEASNACGVSRKTAEVEVNVRPTLDIAGIEVTQGIQTFDLTGSGPKNTLPTIKGKDTIVRVYVEADRDGFNGDEVPDVTGRLRLARGREYAPINGQVPTSMTLTTAGKKKITATANPDRSDADSSLNFRIPSSETPDSTTLHAEIIGPEICGGEATDTEQLVWNWDKNGTLPVRYVRIRDTGPNGLNDQPTQQEAMFTVQRAFDLLPAPATDIGPARKSTFRSGRDLTQNGALNGLLNDIDDLHTCNALEWIVDLVTGLDCEDNKYWMGIYNQSYSTGMGYCPGKTSLTYQTTAPWPNPNTSTFRTVAAHEIGHNLGFSHVNVCCGSNCPLFNCGQYNHPNAGILQEIVFDPFYNRTLSINVADFMSYGCLNYVSADSWQRLLNVI